jgi:ATP-dependent Clp protease ATP-binding subunit ClpC
MFEMFSEAGRRILFFARYEASVLGSTTIEPEHLLLGILRESGAAARYLVANGFDLNLLRSEIEEGVSRGPLVSTAADIPLSGSAKEALELAVEEARSRPIHVIDSEELLMGIFREGKSAAARILARGSFNLEGLRGGVRASQGGLWPCRRCGQVMSRAEVVPAFRVRLDTHRQPAPPLASVAAAVCAGCGLVEFAVEELARLHDEPT